MNLIGLAELADMYGVSKNTANTWARRHDFPAPVANLKMGPVWNRDAILAHRPLPGPTRTAISTPGGGLTLLITPAPCIGCDFPEIQIDPKSLQLVDAGGASLEYSYTCPGCGRGETHVYIYAEEIE